MQMVHYNGYNNNNNIYLKSNIQCMKYEFSGPDPFISRLNTVSNIIIIIIWDSEDINEKDHNSLHNLIH